MKNKQIEYQGPIVLAVMDGIGMRAARSGNAVHQACTEFLDMAMSKYLNIPLNASGEAVGIMSGQMGNSEVGHNAMGAGQKIKQGIAQVEEAFATGAIWDTDSWREIVRRTSVGHEKRAEHTLHFAGIFSDGGVHSDLKHLEAMIDRAYQDGVRKIRLHAIFDGRDVSPQSEPKYIKRIEKFCKQYKDADIAIASGAGRMVAVADRYENDWGMVALGWNMMVTGGAANLNGKKPKSGDAVETEHGKLYFFSSAEAAIKTFREANPKIQDQYLPAFVVIDKNGKPVGPVSTGDAFVYYDFRADRAIEIARAFTEKNFHKFERTLYDEIVPRAKSQDEANFSVTITASSDHGKTQTVTKAIPKKNANGLIARVQKAFDEVNTSIETTGDLSEVISKTVNSVSEAAGKVAQAVANPRPEVYFVGLTEYDADKHIPEHTLVPPVVIEAPLNVFLGREGISQLAVSETVKFGHITYYFNGNSYATAPGEVQIEIESDSQPFNTRPWMKAAEITDVVIEEMDKYDFIRINYPNGDMVGHFAELEPTIVAVEAVDIQLARLAKKVDELGGMLIITADHGNAEELLDKEGVAKTSHTTNLVPCIFYDNTPNAKKYKNAGLKNAGLTNLAATVAALLGRADYPAMWEKPLIK